MGYEPGGCSVLEKLGERQGEAGEDLLVAESVADLQRLHLPDWSWSRTEHIHHIELMRSLS